MGARHYSFKKNVTILVMLAAEVVPLMPFLGEAAGSLPILDVKEVINKTLESNSDIKKTYRSAESARIGMEDARADFLPSVNANVAFSRQGSGRSVQYDYSGASANASADLTIFKGFTTINGLKKAQCTLLSALNTQEARKQSIIYSVFSQYIETYLDSEIVCLEEENVIAQNQQLHKIKAFTESGQRSLEDVLSQKTMLAVAEKNLVNARHDYELSKLKLVQIMGNDSISPNFQLAKLTLDSVTFKPDSLISMAWSQRKDIEAQSNLVRASDYQISIDKGGLWPSLSLNAGTGIDFSSTGVLNSVSGQTSDKNVTASAGLTLSIPIFDKFATVHDISRAKIQAEQDRADLRDIQRQVMYEVKQALLDFLTAQKQIQVTRVELESAQQAFAVTQARYDVGASTLTDLIMAHAQFHTAQSDYTSAFYTLALRTVGVGYYSGNVEKIIALYLGDQK